MIIPFGFWGSKNIVKDNLILWWDAGNFLSYPSSGTAIDDLTSNNYDGILNGPVYNSGNGGKFVHTESNNDWINSSGTTSSPASVETSDFTAEVWCRPNNVNQQSWLWTNRNNSTGSQLSIICGSPDVNSNVTLSKRFGGFIVNGNSTNFKSFVTNSDYVDGNWKHVVFTRAGSTLKFYINGSEVAYTLVINLGSGTADVSTSTTWRSGDNGAGNGLFALDGDTSIYRLYNKELTLEEIEQNFNTEKGRYGL